MQKKAASTVAETRKQELEAIKNEIEKCKLQGKTADGITTDGKRDIGVALELSKKTLDKKAVKNTQTKIDLGLEQLQECLEKLKSKKAKMSL